MSDFLFFRMKKVEKRQVAQLGNLKLFETDYILEQATPDEGGILQVKNTFLLPQDDEFISLTDASARSGLSVAELKRLCEVGAVNAKKVSGNWMINPSSL